CAVRICRMLDLQRHNRLLIVGAGPIGLFTLQAALILGVREIAVVDLNADRLAIARKIGAVTAQSVERLAASFLPAGAGTGPQAFFDAAVDAVGRTATRNQCIKAVRFGGKVVFSGLHEADSALAVNTAIRNELALLGSFAYAREDFATALMWIIGKRASLMNWTETAMLSDGAQCFENLIRQSGKMAKIVLRVQA
ncbi:MAG TPA: zinc-binding dehydrogenase, partial [Bacilli bacterium]